MSPPMRRPPSFTKSRKLCSAGQLRNINNCVGRKAQMKTGMTVGSQFTHRLGLQFSSPLKGRSY
ncbi:hypothetical protein BC835DRAFT_1336318 [Cytidiella melzeri]|nr:hypothetical protein BC835DRAFT_1336318 [Cytidiella melzeri]